MTFKEAQAMRKRLDLTGQRFGKLTVLRSAEDINGRTAWVCRCDCGQETVVMTNNLRSGRSRSCGGHPNTKIARKAMAAKRMRRNDTGSVPGVEWLPHKRQWRVTISFQGRQYYIGVYPEFEDAVEAREQAEKARTRAERSLRANFLRAITKV